MCGILGFTGAPQTEKLKKMLDSIKHRGPDGEGKLETAGFTIGMRRLAIIDPNGGWQPIWNEDKTIAIVFNGEIYNYEELWRELKTAGHRFATDHSDTETIVHGYEEWGVDILKRLRGMFAFAVYDQRKNQLFIARDRLGIKPLYYTRSDNRFIFASEIKALLESLKTKPVLNKETLYEYLMFRTHDHKEETFFEGIYRLSPAHYMILTPDGEVKEFKKYWDPNINTNFSGNKSDQQYADDLKEIFIDTVKHHLISDVPVGVALSGGLDSTGIVSIANYLFNKKESDLHTKGLLTFSAVYPNNKIDETMYIEEAVKYTGCIKNYTYPQIDQFWDELDEWIYTQEEPTISTAPYAGYCLMRDASKQVKVILSGQGGDELLAGYIPYFQSFVQSASDSGKSLTAIIEMFKGFDLYSGYLIEGVKQKLLSNTYFKAEDIINKDSFPQSNFNYKIERNLNKRLFQDITMFSIPNINRYEDKNSMKFSMESRVPFLDHILVEHILSLPIDQKIKNGWNRYVYRNALKGLIPESIRTRRKKIGFTTPESEWIKARDKFVISVFDSAECRDRKLFNNDKLIEEFKNWCDGKKRGNNMLFWRALNSELWIRRFNVEVRSS